MAPTTRKRTGAKKLIDRREEVLRGCERFLAWEGRRPYREILKELARDVGPEEQRDFYGQGEINISRSPPATRPPGDQYAARLSCW